MTRIVCDVCGREMVFGTEVTVSLRQYKQLPSDFDKTPFLKYVKNYDLCFDCIEKIFMDKH